jgi:hypothetical protein
LTRSRHLSIRWPARFFRICGSRQSVLSGAALFLTLVLVLRTVSGLPGLATRHQHGATAHTHGAGAIAHEHSGLLDHAGSAHRHSHDPVPFRSARDASGVSARAPIRTNAYPVRIAVRKPPPEHGRHHDAPEPGRRPPFGKGDYYSAATAVAMHQGEVVAPWISASAGMALPDHGGINPSACIENRQPRAPPFAPFLQNI